MTRITFLMHPACNITPREQYAALVAMCTPLLRASNINDPPSRISNPDDFRVAIFWRVHPPYLATMLKRHAREMLPLVETQLWDTVSRESYDAHGRRWWEVNSVRVD